MNRGRLVARDAEVAAIGAALAAATAGRGRLVVISGDAGIGKSALVDVIAENAVAAGAVVSQGRAWEFADSPPYFAVRVCLRDLGIAPDDDTPFALWERVLEELARSTRERPRVWIVEDAHVADVMTLDLLAFLARPVRNLATLIVVTRRDRDPRLTPAAEQRLAHLARDGEQISLGPLDDAAIETIAGEAAGRRLPRATVRQLSELTGGNPLFVVECARALRSSGDAPLPDSLRRLVQDRVALLPEATRDVLAAAAVLGRELSLSILARVVDRMPARVLDQLAPAIRAGVIGEPTPGELAFSHAVVRDAIEDGVPGPLRAALHHRAATALAGVAATPATVVERARHVLDAVHVQADPDAAEIVAHAIELLAERGAFEHAFVLARRLDQARRQGAIAAGSDDDRLRVAQLAMAAGRIADARRICDDLRDDARRRHDPGALARATLVGATNLRPAIVDPALVAALEEARAGLDEADVALACRVDARLAAARQPAADPSGPVALAEDAIARARAVGDPRLLCEVIDVAGAALVAYAPVARRIQLADEQIALCASLDDSARRLRAHTRKAMDLLEAGEVVRYAAEVDELLALAMKSGRAADRWRPLLMASMRAVAEGRLADSERFTVEVEEMAAMIDDPALRASLGAHVGQRMALAHQGELLLAQLPALRGQLEGFSRATVVEHAYRAMVFARLEDRAAVAAELARLGPALGDLIGATTFGNTLAEAVALAGTDDQRRLLRDALAAVAVTDLVNGHVAIHYDGPVDAARGLLDAALGDRATAERRLRAALALAEQRGHRLWVAQVSYWLGGITGDASVIERAAQVAAEVGMTGLVERANARLSRRPVAVVAERPRLAMAREGDVWRIEGGTAVVRVKDSRGMQLLARLVERPGEEIHVLALASDDPGAQLHEAAAPTTVDERARREYKAQLDELAEEIAAAEARNDTARASALAAARESLAGELARAIGIGGAARRLGSAGERARVNVQRRVKDAIQRIAQVDAALGRYLEIAVRTGTYCCFRP